MTHVGLIWPCDAEITIELNPGTVDKEKIEQYKKAGINRFSIGLQTGFDDQLKRLNRIHTAKDFLLTTTISPWLGSW